jgi:hypothetical protein
LRKEEPTTLILNVKEHHCELFKTALLYRIVLLARLKDICDVSDAKTGKIEVTVDELKILSNPSRGLSDVYACAQQVFDVFILPV